MSFVNWKHDLSSTFAEADMEVYYSVKCGVITALTFLQNIHNRRNTAHPQGWELIALAMKLYFSTRYDFFFKSTAHSRFVPSQWETSLQSNAVSHWLGANLESGLQVQSLHCVFRKPISRGRPFILCWLAEWLPPFKDHGMASGMTKPPKGGWERYIIYFVYL